MTRHMCITWLACEAVEGPRADRHLAREVAGALANDSDAVSQDALDWLGRHAEDGRRWHRQARGCLDELDRLGRHSDTIPCPAPFSEAAHV